MSASFVATATPSAHVSWFGCCESLKTCHTSMYSPTYMPQTPNTNICQPLRGLAVQNCSKKIPACLWCCPYISATWCTALVVTSLFPQTVSPVSLPSHSGCCRGCISQLQALAHNLKHVFTQTIHCNNPPQLCHHHRLPLLVILLERGEGTCHSAGHLVVDLVQLQQITSDSAA